MSTTRATKYRSAIESAGISIYVPLDPITSDLYIPDDVLIEMLKPVLLGINFTGIPIRTRSRLIKEKVCLALGYPIPKSFTKVQPRFTGQNLDIYNQQGLNLQIWNEPIDPSRRYVLVRIGDDCVVKDVIVLDGIKVAAMDKTGKRTTKYQATFPQDLATAKLYSPFDTSALAKCLREGASINPNDLPTDSPQESSLLSIYKLFTLLKDLVGKSFPDPGANQDRLRGAELHKLVCQQLGYATYADNGKFPDVRHQLLEVKLQTSRTIDLGLILPTSIVALEGIPALRVAPSEIGTSFQPTHQDTRYAMFGASIENGVVRIRSLAMIVGRDFFSSFRQFEGKKQNSKLQIPLSENLFAR